MKLNDFLKRASTGQPHAGREIEFFVVQPDPAKQAAGPSEPVRVRARLVYINDEARTEIGPAARRAIAERFEHAPTTQADEADEAAYQKIARVVRDADRPSDFFFADADEARRALPDAVEATRILEAYSAYREEEFPATISDEEFNALVDEAEAFFGNPRPTFSACSTRDRAAASLRAFLRAARSGI